MSDRLEMGRLREGFRMIGSDEPSPDEPNEDEMFTGLDEDDGDWYGEEDDSEPTILEYEKVVNDAVLAKAQFVTIPILLAQQVLTELFMGDSFSDGDGIVL